MSLTEWKVCRIYDPAVDLSDKLDEHSQPVFETDEGGKRRQIFVSDVPKFLETRDIACLKMREGMRPALFVLRPITSTQLRGWVNLGATVEERYTRAFECALVRIEDWTPPDSSSSTTISIEHDRAGVLKMKDGELDRLMALGIVETDWLDVGCAAYTRARVPFGPGASSLVPPSSVLALGQAKLCCQRAALNAQRSTGKSAAKGAPAEVLSTPSS